MHVWCDFVMTFNLNVDVETVIILEVVNCSKINIRLYNDQ